MRIGVDLGGTKIEAIAIDKTGHELWRRRIATPAGTIFKSSTPSTNCAGSRNGAITEG